MKLHVNVHLKCHKLPLYVGPFKTNSVKSTLMNDSAIE